jgi:hypothetical protein
MYQIVIIAAATVALGASPTVAQVSQAQANTGKSAAASEQKKYCLEYDNVVGSRLTGRECKTKSEWAKEHVDVEAMLRSK